MLLLRNLLYWALMILFTPILFIFLILAAPFPRGIHKMATFWALCGVARR